MSMVDGGRAAMLVMDLISHYENFCNGNNCDLKEYYKRLYEISRSISSIAEKRLNDLNLRGWNGFDWVDRVIGSARWRSQYTVKTVITKLTGESMLDFARRQLALNEEVVESRTLTASV